MSEKPSIYGAQLQEKLQEVRYVVPSLFQLQKTRQSFIFPNFMKHPLLFCFTLLFNFSMLPYILP